MSIFTRKPHPTLQLVFELREKIWALEKRVNEQDKTIEELRIRLSGPKEAPQHKDSDWLDRRRELEKRYAKQSDVA